MGVISSVQKFLGLERSIVYPPLGSGVDNFWPYVNFEGSTYGIGGFQTTMPGSRTEEIGESYESLVAHAFKGNAIAFACEMTRIQVFSQARFQWQQMRKGQPDALFGTGDLGILEKPWPGGTTGDLLTKMLIHADYGGNAFVTRRPGGLRAMRPNWVSIVLGSMDDPDMTSDDLDAEFLGIVYYPGGKWSGQTPVPLFRDQVAHFAPIQDPTAAYRGMSWLTPIVREVMGDVAASTHKLKFYENAGTPNLVVKRDDAPAKEAFREWMTMMEEGHKGLANAYKTLYLTAGADATVVGRDMQQLDLKAVQGAGETRIAAAAGVHPVIVGLSEGMQGSSLNAGNFNSARRLVADKTLWHLWSNVAGSLETIVPPPAGSRLWIDSNIPFLREDRKDAAEIAQIKAATIGQYVRDGFTAESAVAAVQGEDEKLLKHTGLFSVQLQPAGTTPASVEPSSTNGTNGKTPVPRSDPVIVNFHDGAFRASPVTVEPADVHVDIHEGAVRVDSPVTVERTEVHIDEGAVRVDSPITVEPAVTNIHEGAVRSETPVTVNPASVTIEEGAVRVDAPVTVERTDVTVEPAEVHVEAPAAKPVKRTVERDKEGRIRSVTETTE
jgi:phage portal protein BeeE